MKSYTFAKRLAHMQGSAIRELLKYGSKPGFIALGGGYPDPRSFPFDLLDSLDKKVKSLYGPLLYQYGKTEGFEPLLRTLPEFFKRKNRAFTPGLHNIAITTGSQQALSILACMFIDQNAKVAVESPTYLGALQAFSLFNPTYIEIQTDNEGIIPEQLEEVLKKNPDLKFVYLIPTFQNPTGRCLPLLRRQQIARLLKKYNTLTVEDDPYSELRYDGEHIPSLYSLIPDNVLHLFTFSKTFAPGFRIGGVIGPKTIVESVSQIKQGLDLYTSNYSQAMLSEYLKQSLIDPHIKKIRKLYKPRRDLMVHCIKKYFPSDFLCCVPEGGMFCWVFTQKKIKYTVKDILLKSIDQNVGFVPGDPFFARKANIPFSMRLNFTNQTEDKIEKGIKIIGSVLHSTKLS